MNDAIKRINDLRKFRALEKNKTRLSGQSLHEYNAIKIERLKQSRDKYYSEIMEKLNGKGNESVNDESLCPVC